MHQRSISKSFARRQSAQALIEFALTLPVLLILVLGSIDLGRGLVYGVAVQDGAREAARLGATAAADNSVTDVVVLNRLIAASAPALVGCTAITTAQSCGGGTWTFTINVVTTNQSWTTLNDGLGGGARSDAAFGGSQLKVTAAGQVSMFQGFTVWGTSLFQIGAQGQAVMVVL